jgi:hypothetical protein
MSHLGPFIEEMEKAIAQLSLEARESVGQFLETVIATMDPLEAIAIGGLLK